jgi:hypothetical protein
VSCLPPSRSTCPAGHALLLAKSEPSPPRFDLDQA